MKYPEIRTKRRGKQLRINFTFLLLGDSAKEVSRIFVVNEGHYLMEENTANDKQ